MLLLSAISAGRSDGSSVRTTVPFLAADCSGCNDEDNVDNVDYQHGYSLCGCVESNLVGKHRSRFCLNPCSVVPAMIISRYMQ
jgi:hypothetical protein